MATAANNSVYEAPSPIQGFGIFAAREFRQGERVVEIEVQ
jgi:hypothetical protein